MHQLRRTSNVVTLQSHSLPSAQCRISRAIHQARWPLACGLLVGSALSHAVSLEIVTPALTLNEGSTMSLQVKANVGAYENVPQGQCTSTGRLVARNPSDTNGAVEGVDYELSSEFSVTFTGSELQAGAAGGSNKSIGGRAQAVPISDVVQLLAIDDHVKEADEPIQLYIDGESVVTTCGEGDYGGSIDVNFAGASYGPVVTLLDKSFDAKLEALKLLPQIESIAVLTVSGSQARNKTLGRQLDLARDGSSARNRVSVKLDGARLPDIGGAAGDDLAAPWGVFVTGDFELGDRTLDAQNSFDFTTNTVIAGIDYKLGEHWVLGGALSRSSADAEVNNKIDTTELEQNALSVFTSFYSNDFYMDLILTQGDNEYDLLRTENGDKAMATTDGTETSVGVGAGYNIGFTTSTLKLFSRVDYMKADLDGYTETADVGLTPVALSDFSLKSFTANVGAGWSWVFNTSFGVLTPEIGLDFEHQFEGDGFNVDGQFVGGGDPGKFEISSLQKDVNYINGSLS